MSTDTATNTAVKTTVAVAAPQLQSTGNKRRFRVQHIQAGRIRSAANRPGRFIIDAQALEDAVERGLFNSLAMFIDHASLFESASLRNLAARTISAEYNPTHQTVTGEIETMDNEAGRVIADLLGQVLDMPPDSRPDIGLSITFYPLFEEGSGDNEPPRITRIEHIESSDFVFQPAANGRILERLSALNHPQGNEEPTMTDPTNDQNQEATKAPTEAPTKAAAETPTEAPAQTKASDEWTQALAQQTINAMLRNAALPDATTNRLAAGQYDTPQQLADAINEARDELAALSAEGVIDIGDEAPRGSHIQLGMSGYDEFEAAYRALLAGTRPQGNVRPLSGVREAYLMLSGDYQMTGMYHPDRVQFASVNTSTMAALTADVLNKRVVNMFAEFPRWWEPFVTKQNFSNLNDAKWITLGGIGELPSVNEGAGYTELDWDDQLETSAFVKKGGYLGITLEAMDRDDTQRLRSAPGALARAAYLSLAKSIAAIFTSNAGVGPTMSDAKALFHADHNNVGTNALTYANFVATRTAMRRQTELNSGEILGALAAPHFLLVPPELEGTAIQVLASEGEPGTANNDVNWLAEGASRDARLAAAARKVIVIDLWTDENDWAAVANPMYQPSIGLGYRYGEAPEIFSVASPTAGLMFTNDVMPIKVRYFFATGPVDWRGMYKHNVA